MADLPIIRVAPNPEIKMHEVGDGQQFAIVDNFLADPHALIANVAGYAGEFVSKPTAHASRGQAMSEHQLGDLRRFIGRRLSKLFPFYRADLILKAFLSNISLRPQELSAYHRVCHTDPQMSPGHQTFAGITYLFAEPELGGTAFYRWRAQDIAVRAYQLAAQDNDAALRYLAEHSAAFRKAPEYMTSSNEIAELLTAVPAKFNRMIFYSGGIPHSAHITRPELLSSDPTKGRLTLNFFAAVRPRDVPGVNP